jgi:hypothetical protein
VNEDIIEKEEAIEEDNPTPRSQVKSQEKTKMLKILKEIPGVLSVESIAGISFARGVPEDEKADHSRATEHTYFKQRLNYSRRKKEAHFKHKQHRMREPARRASYGDEF